MRGYVLAEAFAKSEPNSIESAMHQWRGAFGPGERQYAWGWFEAGVRGEKWGLGAVWRQDYDLRFSQDAGALYGAIKNHQALPVGRVYDVAVQAHIVHASGLRGSWRDGYGENLQFEVGVSLLRSNYLIEGSLQGAATVTAPKEYTYTAEVDYAYTKDILFERQVSPRYGVGITMDAAFRWQATPDWLVRGQVRDLAGSLYWRDLPFTVATATSARRQTDADGYTRWDPMISGVEGNYASYRQILPVRGELEVAYSGWRLTPEVGVNYQFGDWLPRVGLGGAVGSWKVTGWVWPTTRGVGVEASKAGWKIGVSADNLQWGLAKTVGFRVGWGF